MKSRSIMFCATILAVLFLFSNTISQTPKGKPTAKSANEVVKGRKLFMSHCASCHGLDGTGAGLVASSLKKQPRDLTAIPKKDGKFPTQELVMTISGELAVPIHGSREMPVWGGVLTTNDVMNLVKYLESIQKPLDGKAK